MRGQQGSLLLGLGAQPGCGLQRCRAHCRSLSLSSPLPESQGQTVCRGASKVAGNAHAGRDHLPGETERGFLREAAFEMSPEAVPCPVVEEGQGLSSPIREGQSEGPRETDYWGWEMEASGPSGEHGRVWAASGTQGAAGHRGLGCKQGLAAQSSRRAQGAAAKSPGSERALCRGGGGPGAAGLLSPVWWRGVRDKRGMPSDPASF